MTGVHPPKREVFDLDAMTNTDPKGIVRPVERYEVTDGVLYMGREADHPQFGYVEAWLVPGAMARFVDFHFRPGFERDQDFYVDVMTIDDADPRRWTTVDLYLDLVTYPPARTDVLDTDEFAAALAAGVITAEVGERALDAAFALAASLAACDHDVREWFRRRGGPEIPARDR